MDWYSMIKRWHGMGIWTKSMVGDAVIAKKITEEEYEEITGDNYVAV